jgi:hypothetical protein
MKARLESCSRCSRVAPPAGPISIMFVCAVLCVTGCKPPGVASSSGSSGNPKPSVGSEKFNLPTKGTTLTDPVVVSVTGKSLARATFAVDNVVAHEASASPFEWTFNPAGYRIGQHVISIMAENTAGSQATSSTEIVVARPPLPVDELQQQIALLPPTYWLEMPYSHLRDAAWNDPNDYRGNVADIMTAASGAVFDTKRERLLVFGGGQLYSGNEIYAFDMTELKWIRITDPSAFPPGDESNGTRQVTHPDGSPVSRHTYDTIAYLPKLDMMYVGGGVAVYPLGDFTDFQTYLLDLETMRWQVTAECPAVAYGSVSAVSPDGLVWQQGGGNTHNVLAAFDPVAKTWTKHGTFPGWYGYYSTMEADPVRNKLVAVGNAATLVWDLANPDAPPTELTTTGDKEIEGAGNPGLAYHPGQDKFVAWKGGDAVYTLDMDTGVWTRIPSTGPVDPGPPNTRGTFGRWAYVPSKDVFIVANEVDRDVFLYRLP